MPFRQHAKTAVIPMLLQGSGACFPLRAPQNPEYFAFLPKFTVFELNLVTFRSAAPLEREYR